jgi:hypothetical protein
MADTVDEDSLDRQSEPAEDSAPVEVEAEESLGSPIPEFSVNRGGRPPGYPKSPLSGRIAGEIPTKSILKNLIAFHRSVVEGQSIHDPSGTKIRIKPTLRERQHSADALTKLLELAREQKAEAKAAQGIGRGHHNPPAAAAAD